MQNQKIRFNINGDIKIELPDIEYISNKKFIIFGIGEVGRKIYEKLVEKVGESAICYIIDSAYPEKYYEKKRVIRSEELNSIDIEEYYFILGSLTNTKSMERILLKFGVNQDKILTCTNMFSEEKVLTSTHLVQTICIYPMIQEQETLDILVNKISWFLNPSKHNIQLYFISNKEKKGYDNAIHIINEEEISNYKFDIMLVWNYSEYKTDNKICAKEKYCIDENYFSNIDLRILTCLRYRLTLEEEKIIEKENSRKNFELYLNRFDRAFIFGLGETIEKNDEDYLSMLDEGGLKIVCNTTIASKELMRKLKPNIYVLGDEVFLTKEYETILDQIIQEILSKEYLFVVPRKWIPLILDRYEKETSLLHKKVVGIDIGAENIGFPNLEKLEVYKKAGNIITRLAIPIASAFCNEIYFAGCDGKKLKQFDGEMWGYSESLNQKTKEMAHTRHKQTVLGDVLDDEYYLIRHYEFMKELIEFGEKLGKKYFSLTESYIPVLRERKR